MFSSRAGLTLLIVATLVIGAFSMMARHHSLQPLTAGDRLTTISQSVADALVPTIKSGGTITAGSYTINDSILGTVTITITTPSSSSVSVTASADNMSASVTGS